MDSGVLDSVEVRSFDPALSEAWDSFVEANEAGTFFHLAAWRQVIEESFGHRCHYLCAMRAGQITGVLPLVHVNSRLFSNALISNAFCVYGGPLAKDPASLAALDEAAEAVGQRLGVDYLEYRMREPHHETWPCNDQLYVTFRKPILPEPEANMLAIPRKQRAMVRKGIKAGLTEEEDQDVERFYRIYSESVRNHGTPVYSKAFFANLKKTFQESCKITIVTKERVALAGVISFRFRKEILPYFGGGIQSARKAAAYDFMYWQVMKRACESGLEIFDFGRSKRDTGSFAFKRHWGFEPTPLHYEYRLFGASEVPEINPLNPKYRMAIALWKRLPLAAANQIGPMVPARWVRRAMVANLTQDAAGDALESRQVPSDQRETSWSQAWLASGLCLLIGLVGMIGLYWSTVQETVRVWYESETFNHCFLILPIVAFLVWRRLDQLKALEPKPWLLGLVPLFGSSLLWLVGNTAGVLVAEQIALVAMAQSLVLTLFGWSVVRAILFPLFFLVFAIPIGVELIPFFQHVTAQLVVPLLRLTGIPVFLENLYLYIPSGSFEVAEACSGVRYLISTVTLGFLAGHILFQSTTRRVIFVLLSFIVPIFANGLRAYGIVMIAHLSDYKYAIGADHLIYGWIFFSFVTFCLLGIGLAMRGKDDEPSETKTPIVEAVRSIGAPRRIAVVFLVAAVTASLGLIYKGYLELGVPEASAASRMALRAESPWLAAAGRSADWQPHYPGATHEHRQGFRSPQGRVDLYTAYYIYQRQGAEVVSAINRPFGEGKDWRRMSAGRRIVDLGDRQLEVREIVARSGQGTRLLWSWFWVDDSFTANRYLAKLMEVKAKLLNRRGEAAVVALSTELGDSPAEAEERLKDFLRNVEPIDAALAAFSAELRG